MTMSRIDSDQRRNPRSVLSARERQVLALIAAGRSSKEIAATLRISLNTVNTHREHIARTSRAHRAQTRARHRSRPSRAALCCTASESTTPLCRRTDAARYVPTNPDCSSRHCRYPWARNSATTAARRVPARPSAGAGASAIPPSRTHHVQMPHLESSTRRRVDGASYLYLAIPRTLGVGVVLARY